MSQMYVLKSEVEWALNAILISHVASTRRGDDGIPIELIQECGDEGVNIMMTLCGRLENGLLTRNVLCSFQFQRRVTQESVAIIEQ